MAIFDILKNDLISESVECVDCANDKPIVEEEEESGDPQAIVDAMIANAPGQQEQIGIILKYAANSVMGQDIWDDALNYYETMDSTEEVPADDTEEVPDELSAEDEVEDDKIPVDDTEEVPAEDDDEFRM